MQRGAELFDGRVRVRPGTLYGALDRLFEDGWLAVDREEVVVLVDELPKSRLADAAAAETGAAQRAGLPSINPVADIGNAVSTMHASH